MIAPRSLPRNAALVYAFLRRHDGPATAYRILDGLRPEGVGAPTAVYRALDRLIALGLAHRIESINAFVACAHPDHMACAHPDHEDGNGFAICGDCGHVAEFVGEGLRRTLGEIAETQGFELDRATVELSGRCSSCRRTDGTADRG